MSDEHICRYCGQSKIDYRVSLDELNKAYEKFIASQINPPVMQLNKDESTNVLLEIMQRKDIEILELNKRTGDKMKKETIEKILRVLLSSLFISIAAVLVLDWRITTAMILTTWGIKIGNDK